MARDENHLVAPLSIRHGFDCVGGTVADKKTMVYITDQIFRCVLLLLLLVLSRTRMLIVIL